MTQAVLDNQASTEPDAENPVFLREITLRNFLSFGPDTPPIELRSLNVLIGANGSGKSNLIEAIAFLRAAPTEFQAVTRQGGGVTEWVWKGSPNADASISAVMNGPDIGQRIAHNIGFRAEDRVFQLAAETIEVHPYSEEDIAKHFAAANKHSSYKFTGEGFRHSSMKGQLDPNASMLALFRDPERYPALTYLVEQYSKIRIYRDWQFGRKSVLRTAQQADLRTETLEEDYSNLALFLNRLRRYPETKKTVLKYLRDLYDGVDDFDVSVIGGSVQIFLTEGDFTIPASRLSDGTLRYLSLIAILCDPTPPPLLCIEEPEMGLHTDLLPKIANLLRDAAERTQLIVTTHSDMLIDALTKYPEVVMVCEKHNHQTEIKRLDADDLAVWLKDYSLGNLWTSGHLGGTRW